MTPAISPRTIAKWYNPEEEQALARRRPTLTFRSEEHWEMGEDRGYYPTLSLAIPVESSEDAINYLRDRTVLAIMPPTSPEVAVETERGYVVVRIREQDLPDKLKQLIERQKGKPLEQEQYRQALGSLPPPTPDDLKSFQTFNALLARIAAESLSEEFQGEVLQDDAPSSNPLIKEKHRQEWLDSTVAPDIIDLNVRSLSGSTPYDYLLYSDGLDRKNDGRLTDYWLKRYSHTESGGWWCNGVDPITGKDALWGCFKPDNPRSEVKESGKAKAIKYEHPPKQPTEVFALKVSDRLWEKIAERSGVSKEGENFWQWLKDNPQVPLLITEGAKKAGAVLSAGYAAIALPGVDNGYRQDYDEGGNKVGERYTTLIKR